MVPATCRCPAIIIIIVCLGGAQRESRWHRIGRIDEHRRGVQSSLSFPCNFVLISVFSKIKITKLLINFSIKHSVVIFAFHFVRHWKLWLLFICVLCLYVTASTKIKGQLMGWENLSVLSFYHVGSDYQTQVLRPGHLYLMSHISDP